MGCVGSQCDGNFAAAGTAAKAGVGNVMWKSSMKKPDWLKMKLPKGNERYLDIQKTLRELNLFTVCQEAHCPNMPQCWGGGTATFMIMGDTCTRGCRFCNVKSGNPKGWLDPAEPEHLAEAIAKLKLDYAVITSVDRDDLSDGGAAHFAECIRFCKEKHPQLLVEVLIPDFAGDKKALQKVIDAKPTVIAHNIETTRPLQKYVRDGRANFDQSVGVLLSVKEKDPGIFTKSSIILGFGEADDDVVSAMKELRQARVDIFTLGQYLRPSQRHMQIVEFVPPARFEKFKKIGEELGFLYVAAGPFVRSSYRAGELFVKSAAKRHTLSI